MRTSSSFAPSIRAIVLAASLAALQFLLFFLAFLPPVVEYTDSSEIGSVLVAPHYRSLLLVGLPLAVIAFIGSRLHASAKSEGGNKGTSTLVAAFVGFTATLWLCLFLWLGASNPSKWNLLALTQPEVWAPVLLGCAALVLGSRGRPTRSAA